MGSRLTLGTVGSFLGVSFWLLQVGCAPTLKGSKAPAPKSSSDLSDSLLTADVKQTGAQSADGKSVPLLCSLADAHLDYMISAAAINHDGFSGRSQEVQKAGGGGTGEIVAYNCGGANRQYGAQTCVNSWVASQGHWELMEPFWEDNCYRMKQTGNCFYCIGFFANGLP